MSASVEPPRLDTRIPEHGFASPDDALTAFLGWVDDLGLRLYPHQEEAILAVFAGHHVVLDAPTGSGKSLVATARLFQSFVELGHAWYAAPIKALVTEKFLELCRVFGPEHVGLLTGDGAVNRGAPIVCCTTEVLANLALREGADAKLHSVVLDEFHYYGDRERGMAWQLPLLTLPDARFLLMSGTLGDTHAIRTDLEARTGRPVTEVRGAHRPVPLHFTYAEKPLLETLSDLTRLGRAPVYVVHFSQREATETASALMSTDWCSKDEKRALADALRGTRFSSPFGPTLRRYLAHGVGLHHAGLLPRYRLLVERLAQAGQLKVICGTDTLGVGVNVPIRTVLFTQLCKYDGERTEILAVRDFRQIAGRAGRAGFDTEGFVVAQAPAHVIENLRIDQEPDPKKKRRMVRAKPPERGFKPWDRSTFERLSTAPPEALKSRFTVDHGRLLTLVQRAAADGRDPIEGLESLRALLARSHASPAEQVELTRKADVLWQSLLDAGVLQERAGALRLDPTLPQDFSLHHALSLCLVDALSTVDPDAPDHAFEVLAWAEAILENPTPLLHAQQNRDRARTLAELKAAGVPYEERVAAIEEIGWPRPHADAIYAFFNEYRRTRPWLAGEDAGIRPKGIAREMLEGFFGFSDMVRELGLPRAEGLLLRYLGEVYRLLDQNVPPTHRTPALEDLIAALRAALATVDTSLLEEWERLRDGAPRDEDATAAPVDVSANPRAFQARIRAELHALVRALASGAWEEAAACLRPFSVGGGGHPLRNASPDGTDDPPAWDAPQLDAAMAPFLAVHGALGFDARARLVHHTTVRPDGPHRWTVRHALLTPHQPGPAALHGFEDPDAPDDDDGATGWTLEAVVDLREDTHPRGPLLTLLAIREP